MNSTRAQCPTVSRLDPILSNQEKRLYIRCDAPEKGWTRMIDKARSSIWGMAPSQVRVSACWSGFVDPSGGHDAHAGTTQYLHPMHDRRREPDH